MSDGTVNSPEVSLASQGDALRNKEGVFLYKSSRFEVFVPQKPNIPISEGLHVQVSSGHDVSDSPKEVLRRYLLAEGVAKVLAESGQTRDAWANTRIEEGQKVSVYGRVPGEEKSWRKPVDTFNRSVAEVNNLDPNYDTQKLQELSGRYLPKWEQLAGNINLFEGEINGRDINEVSREGFVVWENKGLRVEIIANAPHVKGLHLVVHPKESFQRQWQIVKGQESEQIYVRQTLEATAVAIGIQKLLAGGKGEIHNSGNWAGGLKTTEEGGKLDLGKLSGNRKLEKRLHRPDIATSEDQFGTGMHVHVYIPSEGPVILPEMSKQEAIERGRGDIVRRWEEIPSTTQTQLEEIRVKLGEGKLTKWLEENCKGQLVGK